MRCASPPESVEARRSSDRYSRPYLVEKQQALADFLENFVGDGGLLRAQFQAVHELPDLGHGHRANFRNRFARDAHRARFRAQPRSVAFRANRIAPVTAQENAHVEFIFFPLEPMEKSVHAVIVGFRIAFDHQLLLRRSEAPKRRIERNAIRASEFFQLGQQHAVPRLGPWLDRALVQRFALVGNHPIDVEIDRVAEALAARAGPVRIIEGK